MLLLFILLMTLQVVNMQLAAEIYPCSDETKSGILHFSEYTHVEICCQLVGKWCNKTTSNDTLTLLPEAGCNGSCISQVHREDACLVKFEISNASSANQGDYSCRLNEETVMIHTVYIIKKPPTPVNISFTCSYNNERTVTFDRGPQSTEYNDAYNITMLEERTSPVMMCNTTKLQCKPGDRICVCKIKLSDRVNPSRNVTIYVTVNRSVQTSWSSGIFTIAGNIIPGPIKLLNVSQVGPHDAQIKFCMHADTRRLCSFMSSRGAPLRFHVLVYREQGTPEILNVTLPTSEKSNNCNLCRLVQLPNLIAFTNYTVIASNSGGGGESNKSRVEFTTTETAPVYPPVVDDFGFRRLDNCSASGRPQPCLIVIWKPLPHEAKGGRELSYYIEVISEHGFQINQTTVDAHAVLSHQNLPPGPLTVKLWSQNVIGRTQNYTRFDIPPKSEAAAPYVLVEFNGDHAFVYVNLTSQIDVPLDVQWCNSDPNKSKSDFNICQDYPSTANFSLQAAINKSFQKFKVQFSTNMEFKEIQNYQPINYYKLAFFNSNPNIASRANATVTKNAYNIIQDMDYYFDEEVHDPMDDSIYYNISRKRRYVSESVSSSETKKKFSISFKKQEMPSTGMIPANCYFDAAKEKVSLTPSQFQDSSSNAVILQWVQTCETDTPQQFLAEYFHVYSSTDAHCTENKTYIDRIDNTLFQPNVLKLPSNTKFACIQTFRRDSFHAADLVIHPVTPYTDDKTKETTGVPVTVIVSVVVPIVFLVLAGISIWFCIKRRRHVGNYTGRAIVLPTESTLDAPTHGMNCTSVSNVPEQTVSEQVDAVSSNSSGDSGRGTENNSRPVNGDDTSYGNNSISSSESSTNHRSSDNSPDFIVDLSGSDMRQDNGTSETGCSSANSREENVCSDSYHEENECSCNHEENENDDSATASESVCGSGESQQSYTDPDQQEVLQKKGLSFNFNSNSSSCSSNNSSSNNNSGSSEFPAENDKNISTSSSSSAKSSENTHNSNCLSESSRGNSGRTVNSSNSITEDIGNCDREEENTSYSVGSNESDRERDHQCETSFHSNSGSGNFRHFESAGCFGQHFENPTPSDAECSLTVPLRLLDRCISSGSESEGDVEKPFIHNSEVHV